MFRQLFETNISISLVIDSGLGLVSLKISRLLAIHRTFKFEFSFGYFQFKVSNMAGHFLGCQDEHSTQHSIGNKRG